MDEQEMIRFLRSELYQAMEHDPALRAALKHIDAGKGTFQDTAQYSERTSELLGQILSKHVDELPEGMREAVCKALLRERYEEVNGICAEVQEQLDAQNGIRLQPQKAPYPAERVQQVAHALEDPTVALSVIQRRAKAPVANVSKSFHDDYMKKNADVRSRLGFKCYLNRVAATGCCKWCTDIAGRYVYGDHPDEVFHRHDNCGCTVTFENGRERQDVWSKRTWQEDPAEVEARANEPVVYTQEEAEKIQAKFSNSLTKPGNGSIIDTGKGEPASNAEIHDFIHSLQEIGFQNVEGFENYSESNEHLLEIVSDFTKLHFDFPEYFKGLNLCLGVCEGMKDDDYAAYLHENQTIYLNPIYYNGIKMFSEQYKNDVTRKYHPTGTTYRATVFHEFGHRVEVVSGESGKKVAKQLFEEQNKRFFTRKLGDVWTAKNLSEYAYQYNYDDFISEAFAEYYGSKTPRDLCRSVVERFMNRGE